MPARALTISLEPSNQFVAPGEVAAVQVVISGLGDSTAPSLGAFLIGITFNQANLAPAGVFYGALLGDPSNAAETDIITTYQAGAVLLDEFSFLPGLTLDPLQPGSFILATLVFEALASGHAPLGFSDIDLSDATFPASTLVAETQPATIVVTPEPSTAILVALGIATLWSRKA